MKKYLAEIVGTFTLVFLGCGVAVISGSSTVVGSLGVCLAFGLTVTAMAYAIGHISGCHLNPAVSLGALAAGRICPVTFLGYTVAQVIGAILGAMAVQYVGPEGNNLGVNLIQAPYSSSQAFALEAIGTFIFLKVILGATDKKAPAGFAGIPIGLALAVLCMLGGPVTGGSFNPARSFGPAIIGGNADAISALSTLIPATLIGAALAGLCHRFCCCSCNDSGCCNEKSSCDSKKGDCKK